MIERSDTITAREYETWSHEKEMYELQAAHVLRVKELDIQAAKLEAKITSWFRIPVTVLKLPLYVLFVIPLTVYAVRGQEVPEQYWALLK